jgi:hypothetical protein
VLDKHRSKERQQRQATLRGETRSKMAQVNVYLDYVREEVQKVPMLKHVSDLFEEKTKLHFEYLIVGVGVLLFIMLFTGFGADMICHLAAFIYPFYMTIKCLEGDDNNEVTFWLIYWSKYCIFRLK